MCHLLTYTVRYHLMWRKICYKQSLRSYSALIQFPTVSLASCVNLGESLNLIISFLHCKMGGIMAPHRAAELIKYHIYYNILGTLSGIECSSKFSYRTSVPCTYLGSQVSRIQNNANVHYKLQNSLQVWVVIFNSI